MVVEDIDFLKKIGAKESYVLLVNSKDRDHSTHTEPSEYVVEFTAPFRNVIGMEILDASIPRTMYNIDKYNNTLRFFIYDASYDFNMFTTETFKEVTIAPGNYSLQTIVPALNAKMTMHLNGDPSARTASITAAFVTNPPEITYLLKFNSSSSFVFDMSCTIGEALGFDAFSQANESAAALVDQRYVKLDVPSKISTDRRYICSLIQSSKDLYFAKPETMRYVYRPASEIDAIQHASMLKLYPGIDEIRANVQARPALTQPLFASYLSIYQPLLANGRLYECVSIPSSSGFFGPESTVYEGPRGVLQYQSVTSSSFAAQRFVPTESGYFKTVYAALYTTSPGDYVIKWKIVTEATGKPDMSAVVASGSIAVDAVDGSYSTALLGGAAVESGTPYWIVFYDDDSNDAVHASVYYNDVPYDANALLVSGTGGAVWSSLDVDNVYYNLSIKIDVSKPYHQMISPGIVNLLGECYTILRCKEIEDHVYTSLAFTKHFMGIAQFKLGDFGVNHNRFDFKVKYKECHPIGRLSRLTLKFETSGGQLYDFKGHNHTMTVAIHYYAPKQGEYFENSILNPNYEADYLNYQFKQEDAEDADAESDEDNELSMYRRVEQRNLR